MNALTRTGLAIAAMAALWSVAPLGAAGPAHGTRRIMGTFCDVQVYLDDDAAARAAVEQALDAMQHVDDLLSNYRPDTELSRMNRGAFQAPFHASAELFDFVAESARYVALTRGAFDPTVGPLVRAWGFFTPTPARPAAPAISAARAAIGFSHVTLNAADRTIRYHVDGIEIDPGGIGKGVAVDRAIALLKALGVKAALVSAGGSTVHALGHPPDRAAWRVAVRDPASADVPLTVVDLADASISTSGVSEKFVREGDRRLSHIFDPRTGEPVAGMCQASVIAPTATASDALTKSAFIDARVDVERTFRALGDVHALRLEGDCAGPRTTWTTPWSAQAFAIPRKSRGLIR